MTARDHILFHRRQITVWCTLEAQRMSAKSSSPR